MRALRYGVLIAALGAGSASAAPAAVRPTAEKLRLLDAALARAEGYVAALESAARGRETGDGCPPGLRVKDLVADLRGRRLAATLGGNLPEAGGAKRDWQVYHICRALAASDPAICADADAIASSGGEYSGAAPLAATYRVNCEVAYQQTRAVAASVRRDPRFPDICRDALPHLAPFKDAAAVDAVCRAWSEDKGGGHEPLLAAMAAGLTRAMGREYLLGAARELTADPAYCPKLSNDYMAAVCRELDDFRRASAAADASRCRGGVCRVLMGGGAASCDDYSRGFMRVACAKSYAAAFTADSREAFARLSGEAERTLAGLDAGASGPVELEQVGVRLDRLYALRARMDKASAAYAPLAATPATPGAAGSPPRRSP